MSNIFEEVLQEVKEFLKLNKQTKATLYFNDGNGELLEVNRWE